MSKQLTKEETGLLFKCAESCGFDMDDGNGLSGKSSLGREVYVGEYPCGEALVATVQTFLNLRENKLEAEIKDLKDILRPVEAGLRIRMSFEDNQAQRIIPKLTLKQCQSVEILVKRLAAEMFYDLMELNDE